jgi:hypothetical protein
MKAARIRRTICALIASSCVVIVPLSLVAEQTKTANKPPTNSSPAKKGHPPKQQPPKQVQPPVTNPNPNPPPPQGQPSKAVWSVYGPPERLRIPDNVETHFTVGAGEKPVSDLRLLQSTLQDTSTLVQLGTDAMSLCAKDTSDKCESPINVAANSIRPITLKIDSNFDSPGVFTGEVRFSVAEQSEAKSFKLTVYSRPLQDVVLGALAILLGLLTYFLTHVWLRARLARDEALLPVLELRETLDVLKEKLKPVSSETGYAFGGFSQAFSMVETQLSDAQIRAYLPPTLTKPGTPSDDWASRFKTYLNPLRDRVAGLVVLTNSGVLQVAPYWSANQNATKTACSTIDGMAGTVNNADTAQAKLAPIIQTLLSTINQPAAQALAPFLAAAPAGLTRFFTSRPDERSLRVDLYRNTLWLWILWLLIAFVAGIYVLIASNLGFGTLADIIKCFFWGLGFSVAGGQLEQLTQSSVTGSFGISVPKA